MQITYTGHAYLDEHSKLDEILAGRDKPSILEHKWDGDDRIPGYTYLGPVTVTTECRPTDELVGAQIETLKAMLQTVRADNQQKENAILDQISKLLAIGYTEAA